MGTVTTLAACGLALAAISPLTAQSCTKRIVCIGDSITEGSVSQPSYRRSLWAALRTAPCGVDFVGTKNGVNGTGAPSGSNFCPKTPAFDMDHFATWGIPSTLMVPLLTPTPPFTADIALVELGTNDVMQALFAPGGTPALAAQSVSIGLTAILQKLNTIPSIQILVATIIPATAPPPLLQTDVDNAIALSNGVIWGLAAANVTILDMHTGFVAATHTYDGIHPNDAGEAHIASRWAGKLAPFLANPTTSANYAHFGRGCGRSPAPRLDFSGPATPGATLVPLFTNLVAGDNVLVVLGVGIAEAARAAPPADCFFLVDPASIVATFSSVYPSLPFGTITVPAFLPPGTELFWQLTGTDAAGAFWASDGGWMRVGT